MISQAKFKMLEVYFGFVSSNIRKTVADISLDDCYHVLQLASEKSKKPDDNDDDHDDD